MNKILAYTLMFSLLGASQMIMSFDFAFAPKKSFTTCKVEKTGAEFEVLSQSCDKAVQSAACSKFEDKPMLADAEPQSCKEVSGIDAIHKAAEKALRSQQNPRIPGAPKVQVPAIVTCKSQKGKTFQSLGGTCDPKVKQEACDVYKDIFGPSQPSACDTYETMQEMQDALKEYAKDGTFPGFGGSIVTCKAKDGSRYALQVDSCDDTELAKQRCAKNDVKEGTFVACKEATTDKQLKEIKDALAKENITYYAGGTLVTCKSKASGIEYVEIAPSCDKQVIKKVCQKSGLDIATPIACNKVQEDQKYQDELASKGMSWVTTCLMKGLGIARPKVSSGCTKEYFKGDPNKKLPLTKEDKLVEQAFCKTGEMIACKDEKTHKKALEETNNPTVVKAHVECEMPSGTRYKLPVSECRDDMKKQACGDNKVVGCKKIMGL